MAYSDFSLEAAIESFDLQEVNGPLFVDCPPQPPGAWLQETLALYRQFVLSSATEKARSEFIVAPILADLDRQNPGKFSIYSGRNLEGDRSLGLNGECDFLVGFSSGSRILRAPILTVVEAKNQDVNSGLGQCVAQLVGAWRFNQRKDSPVKRIYGCVTTGDEWQFLQLIDHQLFIDTDLYFIAQLPQLLGVLQYSLDQASQGITPGS